MVSTSASPRILPFWRFSILLAAMVCGGSYVLLRSAAAKAAHGTKTTAAAPSWLRASGGRVEAARLPAIIASSSIRELAAALALDPAVAEELGVDEPTRTLALAELVRRGALQELATILCAQPWDGAAASQVRNAVLSAGPAIQPYLRAQPCEFASSVLALVAQEGWLPDPPNWLQLADPTAAPR